MDSAQNERVTSPTDPAATKTTLRAMRIIGLALSVGPVMFLAVILFLHFTSTSESDNGDSIGAVLSWIHLALALILIPVALRVRAPLEKRTFNTLRNKPHGRTHPGTPIEHQSIQAGWIIHLAVIEGVAFFGLVVLFLASSSGQLRATPIYWLNAITSVGFLFYVLSQLPDQVSLESRVRKLS